MVPRWITRKLAPTALGLTLVGAAPRVEAAGPVVFTLAQILDLADRNHPNVAQAQAKLAQARATEDELKWLPFGQFKASGGVAIVPALMGNNVFSPNTDASLSSSLGVAWRVGIEGIVPLWTFGKVTNAWDASKASVRLGEATLEKERDAVRFDVRKAFFGLQLARDSKYMLKDVRGAIDKAQKRIQEQLAKDEGDPVDLLRVQTYGAELEARDVEADRFVTVALAGLRFYAGVPELDIPDEPLHPPKHQLGHISRYLEAAHIHRPEIAMARAGIDARTAQVHLSRSMLFPDFGIALQANVSAAPAIADQLNPFVVDPGNYFHYGAALAFQWKLDFLSGAARVRFAEAQLAEVVAQQRYALGGVAAEIEAAYAQVVDWKKRVEIYQRAVVTAKRWLVTVQSGIDVGTIPEKDLLEPARMYALNRFNAVNATMELDMAMSTLARATGWDAIAPDGR